MEKSDLVTNVLKELCEAEAIHPEDSLRDDLGMDSLSMISLLVLLEEELGIEFSETDLDPLSLQTVSDVVDLAQRYGVDSKC